MRSNRKLGAEDRGFFDLVHRAILSNPFSDERVDIELEIGGRVPGGSKLERVYRTIQTVEDRLARLEQNSAEDLNRFSSDDRALIRSALLFVFFYKYRKKFDQLIVDQLAAGASPVKVPFAGSAIARLKKWGFDPAYTFALCYQLRRAYFFIDRELVGTSSAMKDLRLNLWNNVFTHNIELYDRYLWNRMEDFSTLILGETGTGKGTAAMAIGRSGFIPYDEGRNCFIESFTRSFVSLNLSQFPETLIESELFGHKKGAFTGAVEDHTGVFARCSPYGSILLDEIGEISIPIQIKLLQVLQDREFYPVGSHEMGRFQGRVIAATNKSLEDIRDKHIFRDDFYYRLCSDVVIVPPLRTRIREDPSELDQLLAKVIARMVGQPSAELTTMVHTAIDRQLGPDYPWPGNVRELEQSVRRILLKRSYEGDDKAISPDLRTRLVEGIARGDIDAQGLMTGYCYLLYQRHGTFEEVARRTRLDRRTVKKHIVAYQKAAPPTRARGSDSGRR
jgi:DNA-binding NtrC family response regulator